MKQIPANSLREYIQKHCKENNSSQIVKRAKEKTSLFDDTPEAKRKCYWISIAISLTGLIFSIVTIIHILILLQQ